MYFQVLSKHLDGFNKSHLIQLQSFAGAADYSARTRTCPVRMSSTCLLRLRQEWKLTWVLHLPWLQRNTLRFVICGTSAPPPRPAASLSASFTITYRRHGPGLNRRVSICSQYDGGLAHSRPVSRRVVLLCSGPERVGVVNGPAAGGTGRILPKGRMNGRGSGHRRSGVFKRPIRFAAVQFSRFIFRGTKTFAFIARWWRRRVMVRCGRGARCRVIRLVCCKSRSTVGLLHRDVAAGRTGRLFGHVSLLRGILEHE